MVAVADGEHSGGMVALIPDSDTRDRLAAALGPARFEQLAQVLGASRVPASGEDTETGDEPDDVEVKDDGDDQDDDTPPGVRVAGLVVLAADTGRALMLQRAMPDPDDDDPDPAAGTWEFPGGHLEPGDTTSLHGAIREWTEETGQPLPPGGLVAHTWTAPNGIYQGHVVVIPRESALDLGAAREIDNPDDDHEQVAWWNLAHAQANPALRPECRKVPWKTLQSLASSAMTAGKPEGKALPDDIEVKNVVASQAGATRYGLPIGTQLGQARNANAAAAQGNARAKDQYETLMAANPADYRKMLDGLDDADLKSLTAITYSFRSSDKRVVAARIAIANAMHRRGLNVNDYGGLGRPTGSGKAGARGKVGTKPGAKGKATARSRAATARASAAQRAGARSVKGSVDERGVGQREVDPREWSRLHSEGWTTRPGDRSGRLYPPGRKGASMDELDEPLFPDVEVKRTTTKPSATRKAQRAGKTIGAEKGDQGDEYPVKTIGDIAAGVKRAKAIKDPERRAEVLAHLRKGAKAIGGPSVNMVPSDDAAAGKGGGKGKSTPPWVKGKAVDLDELEAFEFAALIERKVMSADPHAVKLREYWAHGKGRAKWRPGTPGDFDRLRRAVRKYIPAPMLNGWVANVHKLATGEWPGRNAHGGKKSADAWFDEPAETGDGLIMFEGKAMAMLTPTDLTERDLLDDEDGAGLDPDGDDAVTLALDHYGDMVDTLTSEEAYEQALADDVDWQIMPDGSLERVEDDEHDGEGDLEPDGDEDDERDVPDPADVMENLFS
jgi:8-oxo-dGTP pyrophosphatase MutT (NUDIX family)